MPENAPKTAWTANPLIAPKDTIDNSTQLARWFVRHQKSEAYNEKTLNALHVRIVALLLVAYACHVVGSPFICFVEDRIALIVIYVLETLCTLICALYFMKICRANASWTAAKRRIYFYFGCCDALCLKS